MTGKPPITLVKLAALGLDKHWFPDSDVRDAEYAATFMQENGGWNSYSMEANAAIATVLNGCEVHEEWGAKIVFPDGRAIEDWRDTRDKAQKVVNAHDGHQSIATATLIRRLIITTPPEETQ